MDENKEWRPVYPSGFADMEEPLQNVKTQIALIDDRILNMPPDRGPAPMPTGGPGRYMGPTRQQKIESLARQKTAIQDRHKAYEDERLLGADPEQAKLVRSLSAHHLSNNAFKNHTNAELKAHGSNKGERLFDKMETLHFNEKSRNAQTDVLLPSNPGTPDPNPGPGSGLSEGFLNSFDQRYQGADHDNIDPDKDDR